MNADYLIEHAKQTSDVTYRDGVAVDRLAYRVGMLEGYIRQLCWQIEDLKTLQNTKGNTNESLSSN